MSEIDELIKLDKRFHESLMKKSFNFFMVFMLKCFSYLPFWLLYLKSDFFYLIIRYIVRYRRKIIQTNLRNAFPEKSPLQINQITNKFYHHFCDMFIETIKAHSMTEKQFEKRIKFRGVDEIARYFSQGKSIIFLGMHYNNWEWILYGQKKVKQQINVLYNPVRGNRAFEDFMTKMRSKWGCRLVPVHKSARITAGFYKGNQPASLYLLADQTPSPTTKFWIPFLNQETPFFSGPEKIAHKSGQPVYFQYVKKIKRGYYEVIHHKLFENPSQVDDKMIMLAYVKKMEEIIREEPEYYLWSHRRWKHKRPSDIPLIKDTVK